jgi:hypothetical protein
MLYISACQCNYFYSTGNCEEGTGRCECRVEFTPPNCDSCSFGYFGYPECRPCDCHPNGTRGFHCESSGGQCPCKPNYSGKFCNKCYDGYYNFPECLCKSYIAYWHCKLHLYVTVRQASFYICFKRLIKSCHYPFQH